MTRARARLKPLRTQVIVITGATSGIGLATARRAADEGATVFLIARGEDDLRALNDELQSKGVRCAYAVCDVADEAGLAEAADKCRRLFGGFDTWVNNAGVSIYGAIRDTTLEDQKRLFDTNYWGVVHGSLIAAEHLRARPDGGALINVGSVLGDAPIPVQGVYSASKHAVKGFTNALRMELLREGAPVSVSLVKPSSIDTPYKDHARNLTGEPVHNPGPVYAAHVVADVILHAAQHPLREITVGGGGRVLASLHHMIPGVAEPLFARLIPRMTRDRQGETVPDDGLWDPTEDGLFEETDYPMVRGFSLLAQARMHPRAAAGGTLAVIALTALAVVLMNRRQPAPLTRMERLRERLDLGRYVPDVDWRGLVERADLGGRASRLRDAGRDALDRIPADRIRSDVSAGAGRAGAYAREHAKEGAGILAGLVAIATLAATAYQLRDEGLDRFRR